MSDYYIFIYSRKSIYKCVFFICNTSQLPRGKKHLLTHANNQNPDRPAHPQGPVETSIGHTIENLYILILAKGGSKPVGTDAQTSSGIHRTQKSLGTPSRETSHIIKTVAKQPTLLYVINTSVIVMRALLSRILHIFLFHLYISPSLQNDSKLY